MSIFQEKGHKELGQLKKVSLNISVRINYSRNHGETGKSTLSLLWLCNVYSFEGDRSGVMCGGVGL